MRTLFGGSVLHISQLCVFVYYSCKEQCTRVSESDYPVAAPSHTPLPYGRYRVTLCSVLSVVISEICIVN